MTYDFAARAPPCSAWGDEPDGDAESQALPRPTKSKPTGNRSPRHLQTLSHPGAGGLRIQFLAYAVRGSVHMPKILSFQYQGVCVVHSVTSVVSDSATLWTVAHQASLSVGFSRQEYWTGLPCSPPGDLPNPGIELMSLMSPALAGVLFH